MTIDDHDATLDAVAPQAAEIVAAFDSVPMDFTGSGWCWGYGGGRDLTRLAPRAADASGDFTGEGPAGWCR